MNDPDPVPLFLDDSGLHFVLGVVFGRVCAERGLISGPLDLQGFIRRDREAAVALIAEILETFPVLHSTIKVSSQAEGIGIWLDAMLAADQNEALRVLQRDVHKAGRRKDDWIA